jgi:Cu+-exporting ATPase
MEYKSIQSSIDKFLNFCKNGRKTIYMSFVLSLLYNLVGLSFAVTGQLSPLVAAIIMPLSTVTIISFVTLMSNWYAKSLSGN